MDERLGAIVAAGLADEELAALAAEARAAALAEVRERLKNAYVEQILAQLADRRPEAAPAPAPAAEDGAPSIPTPAAPGAPHAPERAGLAAELAALRARLAENRSWLTGNVPSAACPTQPAEATAPPAIQEAPPAARTQPAALLWVYAVRRAGAALGAIPGVAAGAPLHAVAWGELEALVSPVPADTFGAEPLAASARDLAWLEPVARAHQQALAALMTAQAPAAPPTIVPMRFATIFAGPERVQAMLAERADELRAALAYLDGRGEWGVKLLVDEAALAGRLADASPAVRELREAIAAKPAGAAYMLQLRLERLAADEARRVADACAEEAHARLAAASVAAERAPLREAAGEQMLLNGAYLVADAAWPAFAAALDALQARYAPLGFRLELTGPWPPYTFAVPRPEAVEEPAGGQG
jgi:hypothetical protein